MAGNAFEATALVGLIAWGMTLIIMILHDVHRHPPVAIPAPEHGGAMIAQGVPYVPGPQYQSYSFTDLRGIAQARELTTDQAASRVPGGVAEPHAVG